MARLYANENFPLPVVEALRAMGNDVLTTHDAGKAGHAIPDEEVLAFARDDERAVFTLNRKHFVRLHHESPRHAGVVVCTFDPEFERQARRIHEVLVDHPALAGRLVRVNRPSA
ncbi:MAG: DUF5615 family PIN-like protein [Rubrobacter sp.]|nr:DUF5615 family PIN-like protein [Rubrobacter sp.]